MNSSDAPNNANCQASHLKDENRRNDGPIPFLLPFIFFMSISSLEPKCGTLAPNEGLISLDWYPAIYAVKLFLTGACLLFFANAYRRYFSSFSRWGVLAGVLGAVVWIALAQFSLPGAPAGSGSVVDNSQNQSDRTQITTEGNPQTRETRGETSEDGFSAWTRWLTPARPAFNPFAAKSEAPLWAWTFFVVRMAGLVLIVPLMEELFLRGFAFRFVCAENWEVLPIGTTAPIVWALTVIYPVLTHPEIFAGIVWFTGITVLAKKTGSLGDCVVAHAITNAALGFWVLYSGQWALL